MAVTGSISVGEIQKAIINGSVPGTNCWAGCVHKGTQKILSDFNKDNKL